MTIVLAASVLCACGTTDVDEGCTNPARVIRHADGIPGQWIVVYAGSVANPDLRTTELENKYHFAASRTYNAGLTGFVAQLSNDVVDALRCEAGIDFIEQDAAMHLDNS